MVGGERAGQRRGCPSITPRTQAFGMVLPHGGHKVHGTASTAPASGLVCSQAGEPGQAGPGERSSRLWKPTLSVPVWCLHGDHHRLQKLRSELPDTLALPRALWVRVGMLPIPPESAQLKKQGYLHIHPRKAMPPRIGPSIQVSSPGEGDESARLRWAAEGHVVSWAPVRNPVALGLDWLLPRKPEGRGPGQARAHQGWQGQLLKPRLCEPGYS